MLSKGVILLVLSVIVLFIIYIASSEQTLVLPGTSLSAPGITIFAPMPGTPPLQSFLPIKEEKKENFTVKFGKRTVPQTPLTPVRSIEVQTDCPPPPPPPQQVESVDISFRHGVPQYRESAPSIAQVVNSGVQISSFNPLMIQ
jgi:hypothetical protein